MHQANNRSTNKPKRKLKYTFSYNYYRQVCDASLYFEKIIKVHAIALYFLEITKAEDELFT